MWPIVGLVGRVGAAYRLTMLQYKIQLAGVISGLKGTGFQVNHDEGPQAQVGKIAGRYKTTPNRRPLSGICRPTKAKPCPSLKQEFLQVTD